MGMTVGTANTANLELTQIRRPKRVAANTKWEKNVELFEIDNIKEGK
jgi:hypothetical protein